MKSWENLAWLVVAAILFVAYNSMKQSILTINTTSKISIGNTKLLSIKSNMLRLETIVFNSEQDNFFNYKGLPHIIFKDLIIDVDGNENITYLNQDF